LYLGPVIYGVAELVEVGSEITVLGARLGTATGSAVLVDCNGQQHALNVSAWSDTAVQIQIPASISGVPFDCAGMLEIHLPGGEVLSTPVTIEPRTDVFFSSDSFADSDHSVLHTFSASHQFSSAVLPASFRSHPIPDGVSNLHAGNVSFTIAQTLVTQFDGGVHVSVTAGPTVSGNRQVITTSVTDDHLWDFSIRADFFIDIPQGIAAPGWSTN